MYSRLIRAADTASPVAVRSLEGLGFSLSILVPVREQYKYNETNDTQKPERSKPLRIALSFCVLTLAPNECGKTYYKHNKSDAPSAIVGQYPTCDLQHDANTNT